VAAWSKALVCGRSLAGNAGSNPAGDMDVCLSRLLCIVKQSCLRRADRSSGTVLPSVMCLSVISKPQQWGGIGPKGATASWKKKKGRRWI